MPRVSDQSARHSDRVERELLYGAAEGVSVRLLTIPPLLDEEFVREQLGRRHRVSSCDRGPKRTGVCA